MELLAADTFTPHIGKNVQVRNSPVVLAIDRVEESGESMPGVARKPFVVIFHGPRDRDAFLPEGSYDCDIEGGPSLMLYIAPMHTPRADRQEYQASFN